MKRTKIWTNRLNINFRILCIFWVRREIKGLVDAIISEKTHALNMIGLICIYIIIFHSNLIRITVK